MSPRLSKIFIPKGIPSYGVSYNKDVNTKEPNFSSFICSRYEAEINLEISNYACDNSGSFRLKNIDEATSVDCDYIRPKKVWIQDMPGLKLGFYLAVEADLVFHEQTFYKDKDEEKSLWFLITAEVDFDDLDDGFVISEVQEYEKGFATDIDYDDSLSPCITEADTEGIADAFLKRYYPAIFQNDSMVDIGAIVNGMGLWIENRHLSKDLHIFGQIFFRTSTTETYPDNCEGPVMETFREGTILIDGRVSFLRNYGSVRHTIIHECLHWYLHRKKFLLAECMKLSESGFKCCITGDMQGHEKSDAAWFLEWQANKIASKVLVPETVLKRKVGEYLEEERTNNQGTPDVYLVTSVVEKVADFFGVSKQVAKIRMEECGYAIVKGAYDYCNGAYLKPYAFSEGPLKEKETFTIGCEDLIILSMQNPELAQLMSNGQLVYSDSHLVVNNPRYIEKKKSRTELTEYARMHLDECGIKFELNTITKHDGATYYRECVLCRGFNGPLKAEYKFKKIDNEDNMAKANAVIQQAERTNELLACVADNPFSQALVNLMEAQHMTVDDLAWESGISDRTIQRYRNAKTKNPKLSTVVAMAIGLDIPYVVSMKLIEAANLKLIPNNEERMLYIFFLSDACTMTVDECNDILKAHKLEPLNGEKE